MADASEQDQEKLSPRRGQRSIRASIKKGWAALINSIKRTWLRLYVEISSELWQRTWSPWRSPSFLIYFVVSVIGFGGLGVWLELYELSFSSPGTVDARLSALRTAILAFFPVVAGTAATQLLWAEDAKHLRSTAFALLSLFLVAALCIYPERVSFKIALIVGGTACLGSLWMWVVANANQHGLLDQIDPVNSTGGAAVQRELPGSFDGFKL